MTTALGTHSVKVESGCRKVGSSTSFGAHSILPPSQAGRGTGQEGTTTPRLHAPQSACWPHGRGRALDIRTNGFRFS